jgi:hypothetical protein
MSMCPCCVFLCNWYPCDGLIHLCDDLTTVGVIRDQTEQQRSIKRAAELFMMVKIIVIIIQ